MTRLSSSVSCSPGGPPALCRQARDARAVREHQRIVQHGQAIGAFPQVTLAEGDYVLIARHDGQVYTREFKVESGLDRDIEVVAKSG